MSGIYDDKTLARIEAHVRWEHARKGAGIETVLDIFRPHRDLLPFDEVQRQLRLEHKQHRGLQEIPLDLIRGSVGRYQDFTGSFLPKKDSMMERWEGVDAATHTQGLPPIELYKVGDIYFVLDGNHRVSVARQNGFDTIQAHVWEFSTPVGLSEDADLDEVLIRAEYREFLEHTKLDQFRPEQSIVFTTPGHYRKLRFQISWYQQVMEEIDGEPCSYEDAVTAWYDMLYTTAVQIIEECGVMERFPKRTVADLYIWTWKHRDDIKRKGGEISLADAAADLPKEGITGFFQRLWRKLKSD